jgi:hypothetical protein
VCLAHRVHLALGGGARGGQLVGERRRARLARRRGRRAQI